MTDDRLDVLFVMQRLVFLRFFGSVLDELVDRGHRVHLLLETDRSDAVEAEWLAKASAKPNFTSEVLDNTRSDPLRSARVEWRLGMEYVRRLGPKYEQRIVGARRGRLERAPGRIRRLASLPLVRSPLGNRLLYRALSAVDRALPPPPGVEPYVETRRPDVLLVCDKGHPGSLTSAYVTAGRELGIPTAVCIASWDNLTNRQRVPVLPDALFVWNERQREEALEFHGIPGDHVVMTGAPRFDDWFGWQATDRTAFLTRVGLDPSKPYVLWVGAAINVAELTEAEYVARWIGALRAHEDPRLRELGVLIRPHPERFSDWLATDFGSFDNVAMWPNGEMSFPIDDSAKADYFDSIHHARAVVGINSSAMIEASIIGRPVLAVLAPEFHDSQFATFHFTYLLEPEGPVRVAGSPEESFARILAALDEDAPSPAAGRFVHEFVRPRGLERPATGEFVDEVEALARRAVSPRPSGDRLSGIAPTVVRLAAGGRAK